MQIAESPTQTRCSLCGSPALKAFDARDYNRGTTSATFNYYRCSTCALLFLHPLPVDLSQHYPDDYYAIPDSSDELHRLAHRQHHRLEMLRHHLSSGCLLEIGPAHGAFAYLAQTSGFEVEVIEMDDRCCRFLEDVAGLRVIKSSDPTSAVKAVQPKDAIVLWHVLEHLADPWECLQQLTARLKVGGTLLIAVPNPQALQLRIFGRRWTHLDAPRHLNLVPAARLVARLGQLDLEPACVTSNDVEGRSWNIFGWRWSLANLSPWRRLRLPLSLLGFGLGVLAAPLERRYLRGSTYTAVFRKTGRP